MNKVLLFITTESNRALAKKIAKSLLRKKLAACVSIKDIYSIYEWKGEIEEAKEVEITIKSKPKFKNDVIDFLLKITSYDVPQIIYKKFNSEKKYVKWLNRSF